MSENESPADKLARLKSAREEREAKKADESRDEKLAAELAAAEKFEELDASGKYNGIRLVPTVCGPVIVRGPTQKEYRGFKAALHLQDQRADALRIMVTACVLHPSHDQFDDYSKTKPGIIDILGDAVCEIGGVVLNPKA